MMPEGLGLSIPLRTQTAKVWDSVSCAVYNQIK